ncbi:hypothetical protein [Phascolarctobacterium sp.]|uniref:hypothetical protein n=1 Tax=Phascolarctobacterium sp. TaxID=2049039 RepID=UPI003077D6E8
MFSYEFQKQLVVMAGATIIYMIAMYAMIDFTHGLLKYLYKLGKNGIAKLKEKGYLK